jgi:hypothetical protein
MSTIQTNAIVDASGGNTTTVNGHNVTSSNMMGRNLIINGDFKVAQRGTSFTASGFSLDRWYHQLSGGTSTTTQQTFALGSEVAGCSKYLKQATSVGANYCGLVYKVEDVKSIHQGKATFSFYAKGTNPAGGNFTVRLGRINTGTTFFDTPLNSTLTLTSTWQRFVYTFDVASFSGMATIGNDSQLYISIHQQPSDNGTAAWELNLTGVQLENAEKASDFEHRSYAEELALCQRYYYQITHTSNRRFGIDGLYSNGTGAGLNVMFTHPVPMRVGPTITLASAMSGTTSFDNDEHYLYLYTTNHSTGRVGCELSSGTTTISAEL